MNGVFREPIDGGSGICAVVDVVVTTVIIVVVGRIIVVISYLQLSLTDGK